MGTGCETKADMDSPLCTGTTSIIYGWIVESAERLPSAVQMPAATRIKRSLFLLHEDPRQMLLDR